ncbi:MAG: HPr(Ser) kinase/phosphatase, partial [Lachnospiraceae bacterium]|nr:HPr(Ser) kinase/phosphatase [Lachnospiraceae bacterium]
MKGIALTKLIEKMSLKNMTPAIDTETIRINDVDVNRPALQLTGFYDHFDNERVQIIGNVEFAYLKSLPATLRDQTMDRLLSSKVPCLVFSRNFQPTPEDIDSAMRHGVPLLVSTQTTSELMAEVIRWLKVELAPMITIHGVLVDVYGEGVLITGESGIGKSEAALELIKRGHRLVADDSVEIRKV